MPRAFGKPTGRGILRANAAVLNALGFSIVCAAVGHAQAPPTTHVLMPTPTTVAWGYYDAAATPVLHIRSGDVIVIGTLITSTPERLEAAGVKPADVESSLRAITSTVTNKGPGGHILTGPIYVDGADSGDVLEVQIQKIDLAIPYAYNALDRKSVV